MKALFIAALFVSSTASADSYDAMYQTQAMEASAAALEDTAKATQRMAAAQEQATYVSEQNQKDAQYAETVRSYQNASPCVFSAVVDASGQRETTDWNGTPVQVYVKVCNGQVVQ